MTIEWAGLIIVIAIFTFTTIGLFYKIGRWAVDMDKNISDCKSFMREINNNISGNMKEIRKEIREDMREIREDMREIRKDIKNILQRLEK